jgi:uncharacterized protein (TIGR00369 family)
MSITPPPIKAREVLGGHDPVFDEDTGTGTVRYTPGAALINPAGTVLGGYLAAMLDDVAGLATWYAAGKRAFATAQMSTSFLRGAKEGETLTATATVSGYGKRQAFVEAKLTRDSDGRTVATATLVQTYLD